MITINFSNHIIIIIIIRVIKSFLLFVSDNIFTDVTVELMVNVLVPLHSFTIMLIIVNLLMTRILIISIIFSDCWMRVSIVLAINYLWLLLIVILIYFIRVIHIMLLLIIVGWVIFIKMINIYLSNWFLFHNHFLALRCHFVNLVHLIRIRLHLRNLYFHIQWRCFLSTDILRVNHWILQNVFILLMLIT